MATKYIFEYQAIEDVANAIRTKGGFTEQMRVKDMPEYIANIEGGGGGPKNYIPFDASITEPIGGIIE